MSFDVVYRNAHRINSHAQTKRRRSASSIVKSQAEVSGGKRQTSFVVLDFGLEVKFQEVTACDHHSTDIR